MMVEGETYQQIIDRYIKYVKSWLGDCCLVFDGCNIIGTTKDHEHTKEEEKNKKTSVNLRMSLPTTSINQD